MRAVVLSNGKESVILREFRNKKGYINVEKTINNGLYTINRETVSPIWAELDALENTDMVIISDVEEGEENDTRLDVVGWMQRVDGNGEYDGITREEAIEIIQRWYADSDYTDKGCERMLDYLARGGAV